MRGRLVFMLCGAALACGLALAPASPAHAGPASAPRAVTIGGGTHYGSTPGTSVKLGAPLAKLGAKVTVKLGGFAPEAPVVLFMPPTLAGHRPTLLATTETRANGTASVPVRIPTSAATGLEQIVVEPVAAGSAVSSGPTGVTTLDVVSSQHNNDVNSRGASLGSDADARGSVLIGLGAAAVGALGMFVLTRRRRGIRSVPIG